jgi:putative glycosyl hydrolase
MSARSTLSALTALVIAALLAAVAAQPASARVTVGIGTQSAGDYTDARLKQLAKRKKIKTARLQLRWDWYKRQNAGYLAGIDAWMAQVRARGLRPMVSLTRDWKHRRTYVPPMAEYRASVAAVKARYPHVRDFTAWNEPNARQQPFRARPALAARYYNAMRAVLGKRYTVAAADIYDGGAWARYLKAYKQKVRGAKVWALHNYLDAKRLGGSTRKFARIVRGKVWLTETGARRRYGLKKQVKAVDNIFRIARSNRRVERVYFYQWRRSDTWDSAFLETNGRKRPAYNALLRNLR